MRQGVCFPIPESADDADSLRRTATPLTEATRPAWLDSSDLDYYRCVGSCREAALTPGETESLREELDALRACGLIVERAAGSAEWRVYIPGRCEYDTWSIGLYSGQSPLRLQPARPNDAPILTRNDVDDVPVVFVADPFMVCHRGTWFMFFEMLNWRANKGEIGLATSTDGLAWRYQQRVLTEPCHLSYPYVFEHDGSFYMIPESRQAGRVQLYRATRFPVEWTPVVTLLEGADLVDASIATVGAQWWLFVGDAAGGRQDTLRLFVADRLTGPWRECDCSPLVAGHADRARPAGRILQWNGRMVRLAQNCQGAYGREVRAFEITALAPDRYSETAIHRPVLAPRGAGWAADGMHHVDAWQLRDGTWRACVDGWRAAS